MATNFRFEEMPAGPPPPPPPPPKPAHKYSIFALELGTVPETLRILGEVRERFRKLSHGQETLFQLVQSVDEAAAEIEAFKNRNCGSVYDLATINLNLIQAEKELAFLLGAGVLGNPRTVFLATLKNYEAAAYALARQKVITEAEAAQEGKFEGAPSCIDSYNASNRAEVAQQAAFLLNAHLNDEESRLKAKQTGVYVAGVLTAASELMHGSTTIFCGPRKRVTRISGKAPRA